MITDDETQQVDPALVSEGLPLYLKDALKTDEAGGYKPYDAVFAEAAARHRGMDNPMLRMAINQYIEQGLIEKKGGKSNYVLRDLTAGYPPRITENMLPYLLEMCRHLSPTEFRTLSFVAVQSVTGRCSNIYNIAAEFIRVGVLIWGGTSNRSKYRRGPYATVAVYPIGSYEDGRLVNLDTEAVSEVVETEIAEEAITPLDQMVAIIGRLEASLRVSQRIEEMRVTLAETGISPDQITRLLAPLRSEYETVGKPNTVQHDLDILSASVPLWQKYMTEEGNGNER